jgi:hypothetical protein
MVKRNKTLETNKLQPSYSEVEIIRPELNLEKWCIWQPAKSQNKLSEVIIKRAIINADGSRLEAKVEVLPNIRYGPPTTETQKVYYALIRLWEKAGKPPRFSFSRYAIAQELKKPWGKSVKKLIDLALDQLQGTVFRWTNAYYDNKNKKLISELNSFTILSALKIKEGAGRFAPDQCFAEFNSLIYENLCSGYTKPLMFEVITSLDNGVAQILYTHLDLVLSSNKDGRYERRTQQLFFEDLQLISKEYNKLSFRKRTLLNILPKLEHAPISIGGYLSISLESTKDSKDLKLVAQKTDKTTTNDAETKFNAKQLVLYFLNQFGIERAIQAKELAQATELLKTYELTEEQGFYFVDFSKKETNKTNFRVASFNGIIKYINSALHDFESNKTTTLTSANNNICSFCVSTWLTLQLLKPTPGATDKVVVKCPHNEQKIKEIEKKHNAIRLIY